MMRQISSTSSSRPNILAYSVLVLGCLSALYLGCRPVAAQSYPSESRLSAAPTRPGLPQFRPSRDNPYPEETESSGVRNDALCEQDSASSTPGDVLTPPQSMPQSMQAIVPDHGLKLTASGRPTFWIALPATAAREVILSIEKINPADNSKLFHGQQSYPIAQTPALVGLPMPKAAPDLEENAFYQWSVILVCGDTPHPSDPFIFATTQRMTPAVRGAETQPVPQSIALSDSGFWYDPLSILLDAYQQNPQDQMLIQSWQSLMESAGLGAIAQQYGPTKSAIHIPAQH